MTQFLFSLSFLLLLTGSLRAQTPQIYRISTPGNHSILCLGSSAYARKTQLIYPAAGLTGAVPGTINRIYFRYSSSGLVLGQTLTNFTIRLGQTPLSSFIPAPTDYSFFLGLDTVLSVAAYTIPYGPSGNWFAIDLPTAFPYDPNLSLIVETKFDASTYASFGTIGSINTLTRKITSPDVNSLTGSVADGILQDFGFDLGAVTAAEQQLSTRALEIYPSPATNQLWIKPADSFFGKARLQLVNALGQLIISKEVTVETAAPDFVVNVQDLPAGLYFVTLTSGSNSCQGTVTVLH
jgi:hypothetical protein